jgi:hypothetical protein
MTEKTHYRKAFNSPYLSSADIVEPTILKVKCVRLEKDKSKKTKDEFNTAYFTAKELRPGEPLKPMILNATNSKTMAKLAGSKYIDDWNGIPITVYVDSNVRFGNDTVEGLRISTEPPQMVKDELLPNTEAWGRAIASYKKNGNLDIVKQHVSISAENEKKLIAEAGERQPGEEG